MMDEMINKEEREKLSIRKKLLSQHILSKRNTKNKFEKDRKDSLKTKNNKPKCILGI